MAKLNGSGQPEKTAHATFRFTPLTKAWLAKIAEQDGVTRTAALERLVRQEGRKRKLGGEA